jgi:hypothetical protein
MLTSMGWLEAAPGDFRAQFRALQRDLALEPRSDVAGRLMALANHALDENQLVKLARLAGDFHGGGAAAPLAPV